MVECSINFGIATAQEVVRRARRGELIYAVDLLVSFRRQVVEAECYLREKPYENVERTVSEELLATLYSSAATLNEGAILSSLSLLVDDYRELVNALHSQYPLTVSRIVHQEALDVITTARDLA